MAAIVVTTQFALPTSTGTFDVTVPGITETCVAAVFFVGGGVTNGTTRPPTMFGVGWCTATDDVTGVSCAAEDGSNNADTASAWSATNCITTFSDDTASLDGQYFLDSMIAGGVRLDTNNPSTAALQVTALLFFGSDVSAVSGSVTPGNANVEVTTNIGQDSDCIFWSHIGTSAAADTVSNESNENLAVSTWDGTTIRQRGFRVRSQHDSSKANVRQSAGPRLSYVYGGGTNITAAAECTTMDGNLVGVTSRESNWDSSVPLRFLSINFSGAIEARVETLDIPTSGNLSSSAFGFTPQCALLGFIRDSTQKTEAGSQQGANNGGTIVGAMDGSRESSFGTADEENANVSNTRGVTQSSVLYGIDPDGVVDVDGSFSSFDTASGFTVTLATNPSAVMTGFAVAFQRQVSGSGAGTLPLLTGTGSGGITAGGVSGSGAGSLPLLSGGGSGAVKVSGSGSGLLPLLTGSGSGLVKVSGSGAGDLPLVAGDGSGLVGLVSGSGAGELPLVQGDGQGVAGRVTGSGSGDLPLLLGSGSGSVKISGSGSGLLPLVSGSGQGRVFVTGSGAGTLPILTGDGSGVTGLVTGSGAGLLPLIEGSGQGVAGRVSGSGAGTLPVLEGSGVGAVRVSGSGQGELPLLDGDGAGVAGRVSGSGAGLLPTLQGSGQGAVKVSGSGAGVLPTLEGTGMGTEGKVSGSGSGFLPTFTGDGAGARVVSGSSAGVLPVLDGDGVGVAGRVTGAGSGDLPLLAGSGQGGVKVSGAGAGDLPLLSGSGSGSTGAVIGSGAASLPELTGSGQGARVVSGSGQGVLPLLTGTGMGAGGTISGSGASILPSLVGDGEGARLVSGEGVGLLPSLSGEGSGAAGRVTGSGAGVLPSLDGSGSGSIKVTGSGSGVLPLLTGGGAGNVLVSGAGQGLLPNLQGDGSGRILVTGSGDGTLPNPVGGGGGSVGGDVSGSGAGLLPALVGDGSGVVPVSGSGAGLLPLMTGTGSGGLSQITGSGAGVLPTPAGSGQGKLPVYGAGAGLLPTLSGTGSAPTPTPGDTELYGLVKKGSTLEFAPNALVGEFRTPDPTLERTRSDLFEMREVYVSWHVIAAQVPPYSTSTAGDSPRLEPGFERMTAEGFAWTLPDDPQGVKIRREMRINTTGLPSGWGPWGRYVGGLYRASAVQFKFVVERPDTSWQVAITGARSIVRLRDPSLYDVTPQEFFARQFMRSRRRSR